MKDTIPSENELYDLAELFKIFGDSTRVKILYSIEGMEKCVNDIGLDLNMTQSAVSHQLRILKQARLVKSRKDGKQVYYSFDDDHVRDIFSQGLKHLKHR